MIRVCATAWPDDAAVEYAVSDAEPDIFPKDRDQIFDRCFTRRRDDDVAGCGSTRRGLGLRLAFRKVTVESHGGRIWVGAPDGGGAAFRLTLPCAAPVDEEVEGAHARL